MSLPIKNTGLSFEVGVFYYLCAQLKEAENLTWKKNSTYEIAS